MTAVKQALWQRLLPKQPLLMEVGSATLHHTLLPHCHDAQLHQLLSDHKVWHTTLHGEPPFPLSPSNHCLYLCVDHQPDRARYPHTPPNSSLDDYCLNGGLSHIDYLQLGPGLDLQALLQGAQRLLQRRAIEWLHLPHLTAPLDESLAHLFERCGVHGYQIIQVAANGQLTRHQQPQSWLTEHPAEVMVLAPRHMGRLMPQEQHRFLLHQTLPQHGIQAQNVIHVGAHLGEAYPNYQQAGCGTVLFIEADPQTYSQLAQRFAHIPAVRCLQGILSDQPQPLTVHRASVRQSHTSSPVNAPIERHSPTETAATLPLNTTTLPALLEWHRIDIKGFNLLILDIKETALKVLRGAESLLGRFDAIIVEVSYRELYAGAPLIDEMDDWLEQRDFVRKAERSPYDINWGDALYVRRRRLSMPTFGKIGRFANQIFQYFALEIMAKQLDAVIETPPWAGNALYGIPSRGLTGPYGVVKDTTDRMAAQQMVPLIQQQPQRDCEIIGYFQPHSSLMRPWRELFLRLYRVQDEIRLPLDQAIETMIGPEATLVVLHLRRGDYGYGYFFVAPEAWYLAFLADIWPRLRNPVLYIASDDLPQVLPAFAHYQPKTAMDLRIGLQGIPYFSDFYVMSQAHLLAISNSSFSFAASMLNQKSRLFMRPDPALEKLIPYDPWNADVLLRDIHPHLLDPKHPSNQRIFDYFGYTPPSG
ncbi:methyltransferase FkbM family [Magnetococcus marinus MC-1]|uniref:Methyltransferase FkbM family n=1 Tax=Magnetococcus marinus (strain ATCC BAA-1437 / JCM 17883 / MC-1) TaxID=156889 RepID=A0L580_MAGMM|nr:FkbM family methyltransferase [Magnetococcus marinus]ABK43123.1 methyltransferase FkbM family [Magnetococcus marinus MC-1]